MTDRDAESLRDLTRPLWSSQLWRVRVNIEHRFEGISPELYAPEDLDELCLDFYRPLSVPEKARKYQRVGSVWIIVRNCGLRMQHRDQVLVNSGDSTSRILAVLPTMIGSHLIEVTVDHPGGDSRFVFENERTLMCFPANSRKGVNWVIGTEAGDEVKLGPGMRISYDTALR
jgi:hypothetical protein